MHGTRTVPSPSRPRSRPVLAAALGLVLAACESDPGAVNAPAWSSGQMSLASIPPSPVSGELAGRRFATRDAYFRVVRQPGRERVDLFFTEGRVARLCEGAVPETARQVWLRFPGSSRLEAGQRRVDPPAGDRPFSIHYEVQENERWVGIQGGSALLSIDRAGPGVLEGRVRMCFGDATRSCLTGSFNAVECRNELDVDGPRAFGQRGFGAGRPGR